MLPARPRGYCLPWVKKNRVRASVRNITCEELSNRKFLRFLNEVGEEKEVQRIRQVFQRIMHVGG